MAAREPKRDRVVGMFDRGAQEKQIERILDRAVNQRLRQTQRALGARRTTTAGLAKSLGRKGGRAIKGSLVNALKAALTRQGPGDTGSSRASVRQKGKDGGRSFHFQVYSVSKAAGAGAQASGGSVRGAKGTGAASAHHAYIEREAALETLYEPGGPEIGITVGKGRTFAEEMERSPEPGDRETGLGFGAGLAGDRGKAERDPTTKVREAEGRERVKDPFDRGTDGPGQARAAQAYIENPVKLRNGEVILNSFGTIGDTFQDRMAFWDLLEQHETQGNARIQNRIICELPHQSTPEARNEILKAFVKPWDEKGIPYHVAVHAPGAANDDRNFHAHIVFSERPAKRMAHPETGEQVWDFTITETYKTSSRNTKTSHPYRQNKLREFGEKGFVMGERKRFAEAVTKVMASVDPSVKFDPRSYAAMGIDVTPMKTVSRILKDRMRQGRTTVLDAAWTKRMIDAELTTLAQARDADLQRMLTLAARVTAMKADFPNVAKVNRRLSPQNRIGPLHRLTKAAFEALMDGRLAIEAERLERRVVARAEEAVCERVIAATNPRKTAAMLRQEDPVTLAAKGTITAGLDADEVLALHEAAKQELAAIKTRIAESDTRLNRLRQANQASWRAAAGAVSALFGPKAPAPAPTADMTDRKVSRPWVPATPAKPTPAPPSKAGSAPPVKRAPARGLVYTPRPTPGPATTPNRDAFRAQTNTIRTRTVETARKRSEPSRAPDPGARRKHPYMTADGKFVYPTPFLQSVSDTMAAMIPSHLKGEAFAKAMAAMIGYTPSPPDDFTPGPPDDFAQPTGSRQAGGRPVETARTPAAPTVATQAAVGPTARDETRPKPVEPPPIVAGWGFDTRFSATTPPRPDDRTKEVPERRLSEGATLLGAATAAPSGEPQAASPGPGRDAQRNPMQTADPLGRADASNRADLAPGPAPGRMDRAPDRRASPPGRNETPMETVMRMARARSEAEGPRPVLPDAPPRSSPRPAAIPATNAVTPASGLTAVASETKAAEGGSGRDEPATPSGKAQHEPPLDNDALTAIQTQAPPEKAEMEAEAAERKKKEKAREARRRASFRNKGRGGR